MTKKNKGFSITKLKDLFFGTLVYLELIILAIIVIYPIVWIIGSSFNPSQSLSSATAIPANADLSNYKRLFEKTKYLSWYKNTFYVAIMTMVFSVALNTLTSFVFARFKFKGKKQLLLTAMILQMFPSFLALTAIYSIALTLNMLDNLNMLVLLYVAGSIPSSIFLVRGFMLNLPKSLDEAAFIDGASKFQIFTKIIFPLSVPIIAFMSLTSFMTPWMDYIMPRILITQSDKRTLAIGLFDFINGTVVDYTAFAAGAVLVGVPIAIIYMCSQKFLIEGLTSGANKGE